MTEYASDDQLEAFDAKLCAEPEKPRPVPGAPQDAPIPEAPAWLVSDEEADAEAEAALAWLESQG